MKKISTCVLGFVVCLFLCGYKFPEKLPMPNDFDTFTFEKVKFGQTSVNEFAYLAPSYTKPEIQGKYTIYSEEELDNNYKSLRAGFKDNFLDWVELEFAVPQSMNKIKQNYGKPKAINTEHSTKFNYHDYGYFNVVTDKNNVSAFGVTLYGESDFNSAIAQIVEKLPAYKDFNFIKEFIPGRLMENDFNAQYKGFLPVASSGEKAEKTYAVPAKYLKNNANYDAVEIVFTNGILSFVNLVPKNLSINDVKKTYGEALVVPTQKENIEFLEYQNFIVTYNKSTNKVLNIGIIGAL